MEVKKPYHLKFSSHIFLENLWEISLPHMDKIEWAVTLTCLSDPDLLDQLKWFISKEYPTDTNKKNAVENAKNDFEKCNPFINEYSFFRKKSLQSLVLILKELLNHHDEQRDQDKLLIALKSLRCNAFIFTENNIQAYPEEQYNSSSIILNMSESGEINNSFRLPETFCQDWKKYALFNILSKMKVPKKFLEDIWITVQDKRNFLISVIRSGHYDVIKYLRNSFIMIRKIRDLGFDVDPKILDSSGVSAFYHGLVTKDSNLCIELYKLAIFFITDENDFTEIRNFENLYNIIRRDFDSVSLRHSGLDITDIYAISCSLISLITLRLEIKYKILGINASFSQKLENFNDVELQRQIMLEILAVYLKNIKYPEKNIEGSVSDLDYYISYKYFYDEVDVEVSLLFFHNIYMLKSKLKLPNKYEYASIESAFFVSVLNYVIFNRKVKISDYFHELNKISPQNSHRIFYDVRNVVQSKVELFRNVLDNTTVDDSSIRREVPTKEFNLLLDSYPEIKEYLLVKRLTNYIESALKVTETTFSLKSVFVIERTLQVLSEFIKMELDSNCCVKWFLYLYMPKNVREVLYKLRDNLTHLGNNAFARKIRAENDFNLFHKIKTDISNIHKYLEPLLLVLLQKTIIYAKKKLEASINNMECTEDYEISFKNVISAMVNNILDISICMYEFLNDDLIFVFNSLLENLDLKLQDEKSKLLLDQNGTVIIQKLLSPLRVLMELAVDNQIFKDDLQKLLLDCKTCCNLNDVNRIIRCAEQLIRKCKEFIANWSKTNELKEFYVLDTIPSIQKFLNILKTPCYMEETDMQLIRKHFKENGREDLEKKIKIELSVKQGFNMNDNQLSNCQISYLSSEKWATLKDHYENRNKKIYDILNLPDPETELEKIFTCNSIKQKNFERLCKIINLPEELVMKLENFVEGRKKQVAENHRLLHLYNRISNLRKIFIDEHVKNGHGTEPCCCKNIINGDEILDHYMEDRNVQLSAELLVLDCMNLFKKNEDDLWRKGSKVYKGVNLRNIMSHEDVMIRTLCEWFDESDFPTDFIQKACVLLKDKNIIKRIIDLYKNKEIFQNLKQLLNSNNADDIEELKALLHCDDIGHCNNIQKYLELLSEDISSPNAENIKV